ncbi:MAG TPA: sigma-70 family RNA polymerase sigma factor [Spirochaetota bacterium]|nr:sigma-70 family RNA polymerase sigma factor [Spirochaetota bacterium]HOM37721.1 sigma-70 family RNA polymerase sigma factor [Spirochaetota bacterium]HPQ49679.1 sigma-70 family RNA polymerase sigma factor [Spirochaetota bacterium]
MANKDKEFDKIFWENKDFVFNIARKFFDEQTAEDILQEVFIIIYVNYKKFRGQSNIRAWIYRITINEVYKRIKKIKREKKFEEIYDIKKSECFDIREIVDIVKSMPEKRAKIIILRGIDNLDFKTIGEIMNISSESAKTLYSLGVKDIREKLGIEKTKGVLNGEGLE